MAITPDVRSGTEHMAVLHTLLTDRGLERYGIFAISGEGETTPDGYDETSGYALSSDGRAYFFWTGWNEAAQRTMFDMWQPTEPQAEWQDDEEYQDARKAAGLA